MSAAVALVVAGAALLCLAAPAGGSRDIARRAAGWLAALAGAALAVSSTGPGVGLASALAALLCAASAFALAAPLWPRPTRAAAALVVAGLLALALGGA